MSQQELVDAYVNGEMSRRLFVRRLVAAGMAFGAAVSYAHLLTPERAPAQTQAHANFYDPPRILSMKMVPDDLDRVIRKQRVKVKVVASQPLPGGFGVEAHLYRSPNRTQWPDAAIGGTFINVTAGNTPQIFSIPVTSPTALYALNLEKKKARIGAQEDSNGSGGRATEIVYKR